MKRIVIALLVILLVAAVAYSVIGHRTYYHPRLKSPDGTRETYFTNMHMLEKYAKDLQRRCDHTSGMETTQLYSAFEAMRKSEERPDVAQLQLSLGSNYWKSANESLLAFDAQFELLDKILTSLEEKRK